MALEIVIEKPGKKGKAPAGDGESPEGMVDDKDGEEVAAQAKREALGKLAAALGLEVEDEGAALEAFEELVYHCSEG